MLQNNFISEFFVFETEEIPYERSEFFLRFERQRAYMGFQKKPSSLMEGIIGLAKNRFGLERVRYRISNGEEIWIRLGLMAMNLNTALKKMEAAA